MPPATFERLAALRQTIHDEVCREGWNEGLGTFVQHYGGQAIDASLLLLPLVGFPSGRRSSRGRDHRDHPA